MTQDRMNLLDACEKAATIVSRAQEMERLYRRGIKCFGEGELRTKIMDIALDAVEDEDMRQEVFVSDENMLSFFCGIWIQFLLIEVAGIKKEKLRAIAQKVFMDFQEDKSLH